MVSSQYIASNLAAEGIETKKNLIDANIIQFRPWNQEFSAGSFEAAYDSLNLETDGNRFYYLIQLIMPITIKAVSRHFFKQVREIDNNNPDEIKMTSKVNWQIKGVLIRLTPKTTSLIGGDHPAAVPAFPKPMSIPIMELTKGFQMALTFDGDFSTLWGNSGGAQGNTSIVSSQHTFATPYHKFHSIQNERGRSLRREL